jgi:hypothetical protein
MYLYDANYIHAAPLHDYSAASYLAAYNEGIAIFKTKRPGINFMPTYEIADNAMTQAFIADLRLRGITCTLVPPNNHRSNNAERAIQTFKNHFIAGLSTCDPSFPVSEVKDIVPQVLITLNLLRKSRSSPLTAQEEIHGLFDSNRFDLHPPGTRVITLDDPSSRASFAPHGPIAFYLGPAMNHYRTYRVYCPDTKRCRNTDSVAWIPFTPVVPKYPTLPPGLFANEPSAAPSTNPTRAYTANPTIDPVTNHPSYSEGDSVAPIPTNQQCNQPMLTPPPSPHSIVDIPLSVTAPPPTITSTLPSAPRFRLTHSSLSEGVYLPAPSRPLQPAPAPQVEESNPGQSTAHPTAYYVHYEQSIRGPDLLTWQTSMDTEMRRLITKTNSMTYLPSGIVPHGAKVATANPITKRKLDPLDHSITTEFRTRLTWGREPISDAHPTSSSTIDTTAVKLFLNSVVSDHTSIVSTIDITDFYLNSKLDKPAYLWVPIRYLPQQTRDWLQVSHLPNTAKLLFEVYNAIYGMDDAGRVSQQDLLKHLLPYGFYMCRHTPGLFRHRSRKSFVFATWVDDFLIKSNPNTTDLSYFTDALSKKYPIKFTESATSYLGYRIQLRRHSDPSLDTLTIDMPDYVTQSLIDLNFTATSKPNSPILYEAPVFGASTQFEPTDDSPPATDAEQSYLRRAVGMFRYYAQAIDSTILLTLSRLASSQAHPTKNTMLLLNRLLNYIAQYPNATIVYRPSNMQLHLHSDESYLSEPLSRSRSAGFSTCGAIIFNGINKPSSINGPIRTTSSIIPTVVGSAMEASYAALYMNAQDATVDRQTLADLGHPQCSTLITYDNSTAGNLANRTAKVKRSKAVAMRYHWIQDRIEDGHFKIQWAPGALNLADYPSKAHPIHHFCSHRRYFITLPTNHAPSIT